MRRFGAGLAIAVAAMTVVATPGVVQARHHYHPNCAANRHHRAVVGTVAGAVAGGVIGNLITHGHGPGTIIGAGVGAVAGHQIGKNSRPC